MTTNDKINILVNCAKKLRKVAKTIEFTPELDRAIIEIKSEIDYLRIELYSNKGEEPISLDDELKRLKKGSKSQKRLETR